MKTVIFERTDTVEYIKQQVKYLQTRYNISQVDVARLLDIPQRTFNAWLTGRVTCRHKRTVSLALEGLHYRLKELWK